MQIHKYIVILEACTGTVHISAKARLTSVAIGIRIRIHDLDRQQNLIICSLAHCQPSLKTSCKSAQKFLRKVASRQRDKHRPLHHILLGGGKNAISMQDCNMMMSHIFYCHAQFWKVCLECLRSGAFLRPLEV